jgi:integrase
VTGLIKKVEAAAPTVSELLEKLKSYYRVQKKDSPQTLSHLKRCEKDFGRYRTDTLTKEIVEAYQARRQKDDEDATINRTTEILKRAYTNAGLNPPPFKKLSGDNVREGFFTRSEIDEVIGHLPEDLKDLVLWGFLTGMRLGEIKSLLWSSVTDDTIRLRGVDAKTKKPRKIVCTGELAALLKRRREARGAKLPGGTVRFSNYIFHRGGLLVGDFKKSWKTAVTAAGCPSRIFHDLRRSGVRNLVRAGVPESVAMKISGHRTRSVFDRYDIGTEDDLAAAMINLQRYHEAEKKKIISIGGSQ